MESFNLGNFINRIIDYSKTTIKGNNQPSSSQANAGEGASFASKIGTNLNKQGGNSSGGKVFINTFSVKAVPLQQLRMNHLASLDRALYVKDLMNMPKDMKDLIVMLQKAMPQSQTQGKSSSSMLNFLTLSDMSNFIQQNGKDALGKLIIAMSNASKQGIGDLSQIKDTMRLINASISAAGQNNPTSTLKSLMLLYMPWLPLQDGVGFDFEIESKGSEGKDSESVLIIMITTRNLGNIKATLTLTSQNSVDTFIICNEKFPKEELLKRLKNAGANYACQSQVAFETVKEKGVVEESKPQAKINMSETNQINPYLLLMAHSLIRHTIELDSETSLSS